MRMRDVVVDLHKIFAKSSHVKESIERLPSACTTTMSLVSLTILALVTSNTTLVIESQSEDNNGGTGPGTSQQEEQCPEQCRQPTAESGGRGGWRPGDRCVRSDETSEEKQTCVHSEDNFHGEANGEILFSFIL